MIVNIYTTVFVIVLILCIRIPSSISVEETSSLPISQNDEDNQTATIIEHSTQIDDNNILSDSNLESMISDVPPPIEENQVSEENQLDTTTQSSINSEIPPTDESPTTPPAKINHSHIDSFEEWKQQQLHAESLKKGNLAHTPSTSSETPISNTIKSSSTSSSSSNFQQISSSVSSSKKGKLRKNFASASCGAKILAHNPEAQHVGSILSSSPDEYMLNPCNAKIWFVIELCESIRILNIEIANFELFSSVPKTFRVSASDRYPTKDWHRYHLGTFNASFNRTVQSFQTILSTTYLKYLKFELLDFHGHEHYCPLSVVRIHGSNVEDEIMTMEDITNQNELKMLTDVQDENEDDDDDLTNDQQVGGIIGSAILDLAKRVFRRQTIRGTQSTTTNPILETNDLKTDCHPKVFNNSLTNESLNSWRQTEQFKQCIANFLFGLWSTFNTCTIYFSQICFQFNHCCQCPPMTTKQYRIHRVQSSINFYIHPCGYYHILTSHLICQKEKFSEINRTNSMTQNLSDEQHLINQTIVSTEETKRDTILSTNQSALNLTDNQSNELIDQQSITTNSTEQPTVVDLSDETIPIIDSPISLDIINDSHSPSSSSSQTNVSESNTIDIEVPETSTENNHIDETVSSTPTISAPDVIPPLISSPWLKGMLVNTKSLPELFKIIEKLNFNLTLSNRYLQELSQHYVKKLDETQQTTDLLLQSSKAADEKLISLEERVLKYHENMAVLSERLSRLEAYNSLIVFLTICLVIWCCILNCRVRRLKSKYRCILNEFDEIKKLKQLDDEDDDEPPVFSNGLTKRRLSTDSSDSNPTRSQRVPDGYLTKITENGFDQIERKLNGVSSSVNHKK